jgi:hypothetical protein
VSGRNFLLKGSKQGPVIYNLVAFEHFGVGEMDMEKDEVLEVFLICPTGCEEVFAKKCFSITDQNLEIRIRNKEKDTIYLKSTIELEGDGEPYRIENLMPYGLKEFKGGDSGSFYGYMDEDLLRKYRYVILQDRIGKNYRYRIELLGYS